MRFSERRPAPEVRGGAFLRTPRKSREGGSVLRYVCELCGFVFDEDELIPCMELPEGSGFYDLPEDWVCPMCGAARDVFLPE